MASAVVTLLSKVLSKLTVFAAIPPAVTFVELETATALDVVLAEHDGLVLFTANLRTLEENHESDS